MRYLKIVLLTLALALVGCGPLEENARDAIAGAKGAIEAAQQQWLAPCQADPSLIPCVTINKAVQAQNLAIDALHVYCGGPGYNAGTTPCEPQASAEFKLKSALMGLNQTISDVKGLR